MPKRTNVNVSSEIHKNFGQFETCPKIVHFGEEASLTHLLSFLSFFVEENVTSEILVFPRQLLWPPWCETPFIFLFSTSRCAEVSSYLQHLNIPHCSELSFTSKQFKKWNFINPPCLPTVNKAEWKLKQDSRNSSKIKKTSQELCLLPSVTINCHVTKIVMNPGSKLSVL